MSGERCDRCKFYKPDLINEGVSECRRFPPVASVVDVICLNEVAGDLLEQNTDRTAEYTTSWRFPLVADEDWCGEFVVKADLESTTFLVAIPNQAPLEHFYISVRLHNTLRAAGINTWEQIRGIDAETFKNEQPNCGRVTMEELVKLQSKPLSFFNMNMHESGK